MFHGSLDCLNFYTDKICTISEAGHAGSKMTISSPTDNIETIALNTANLAPGLTMTLSSLTDLSFAIDFLSREFQSFEYSEHAFSQKFSIIHV